MIKDITKDEVDKLKPTKKEIENKYGGLLQKLKQLEKNETAYEKLVCRVVQLEWYINWLDKIQFEYSINNPEKKLDEIALRKEYDRQFNRIINMINKLSKFVTTIEGLKMPNRISDIYREVEVICSNDEVTNLLKEFFPTIRNTLSKKEKELQEINKQLEKLDKILQT